MPTFIGRLAIVIAALIGIAVITVAGVWVWLQSDTPTPVQQLLTNDATIDLSAYDGSDPPEAGEPAVLILGVPHAPASISTPTRNVADSHLQTRRRSSNLWSVTP